MNDLEAVDNYIVQCKRFVNPALLRDITSRGLYHVINFLPGNIDEAKAIARGRLAKMGRCFGDEQIDQIANNVKRLEFLRDELNKLNMADAHELSPILIEMQELTGFVRDYFKPIKID